MSQVQLAVEMDRLRGRILSLIEALGLPPQREASLKSVVKALTFDAQSRIKAVMEDDDLRISITATANAREEIEGLLEDLKADLDTIEDAIEKGHIEFAFQFLALRLSELNQEAAEQQELLRLRTKFAEQQR